MTKTLGVNAQVVCDCGKRNFEVFVQIEANGENNIRMLLCCVCNRSMPIPYMSEPSGGLNAPRNETPV